MDFSLFYLPTWRSHYTESLNAFYESMTESVRLADRLGWARVLTTEHHFHYYGGPVPNPAVLLAAWARETKHIRLSAGVSLVPLRHPLQVAEDYAMVDQLSGGRFEMGISRGFVPHEFDAFGIDRAETAERVSEALEVIQRFWRGEPFEHHGRFHSFGRLQPWPRPLQDVIPIWIAASNDRLSFERAGSAGLRLMMNQYPMSVDSLAEKHRWYCEAYAAAGHPAQARRSGVSFMVCIADSEEEALERAGLPLAEHAGAFVKLLQHDEWDDSTPADLRGLTALSGATDPLELVRARTLICSPEEAARRLEPYARMGFNEAIFIARFGAMDPRHCTETIERLTNEVKPLLAARLAAR